jgi:hypothetical protein
MELFRTWGIADAVRDASVACEPTGAVRRTLAAEPLAVVPLGFPSLREALRAGPELPALCPQDLIELLVTPYHDRAVPSRTHPLSRHRNPRQAHRSRRLSASS